MTRTTATLSNCYVPLVASVVKESREERQTRLSSSRSSGDGGTRGPNALRRLCMETSVTNASGSALVELGHTKVLCEVLGPLSDSNTVMEEGIMRCNVRYTPHIGIKPETQVSSAVRTLDAQVGTSMGKLNSQTMSQQVEMSSRLYDALSAAVPLEKLPKSLLNVNVTVLQDDGSALSAAIAASTLALANANVEMNDLVVSSTVACFLSEKTVLLADPTEDEVAAADAVVTLAVMPNWKEVTLWDQTGRLSAQSSSEAVDLARDGCRTLYKFMRQCLIDSHR